MRTAVFTAILLVSMAAAAAQSAPVPKTAQDNPGHTQLNEYLNAIAAKETAARREEIAKITTREQAEARQQAVRAKMLELMGGSYEKTPLNARVLGATQLDGFRIEKVVYESQPKFYVTALLYVPDAKTAEEAKAKLPAIVVSAGHYANGKSSDFIIASELARNGFIVLSYDPIGQGERLQYPDPVQPDKTLVTGPTGEHSEAGLQPTLIGDALARYFAWDAVRAVDYLVSRPEVDPERIGAYGCSGGGVMTALLTAADRRVKAAGVACYITSFDALLSSIGPQDAVLFTPNFIASGFDLADWVEVAAPRPYAIIGTVQDMFPWQGLLASAREARRFYSLYDPSAAGTPTGRPERPTPTGPTLNPDTPNDVPVTAPLQVIAGIGTHAEAVPGASSPKSTPAAPAEQDHVLHRLRITMEPGITVDAEFYRPTDDKRHPTLLVLRPDLSDATATQRAEEIARFRGMAKSGTAG